MNVIKYLLKKKEKSHYCFVLNFFFFFFNAYQEFGLKVNRPYKLI